MRYLGAHLPITGGMHKAVEKADEFKLSALQVIPTAPIRWVTKEIDDEKTEKFAEALVGSSVKKVLIHGIYLTNLARKDKQLFHLGKESLLNYLKFAAKLENLTSDSEVEILGVTFHPGSVQDQTYEKSLERVSKGLDWILEREEGSRLLLETAAGSGTVLGAKLEELDQMRRATKDKDRVGYVLDTQHMWASGYNFETELDEIVEQIDNILGIDLISAIHLNDSKTDFNSQTDRHADLGEGTIGLSTITNIVNHPKLIHIPFIMETPGAKKKDLKSEFSKLNNIANE